MFNPLVPSRFLVVADLVVNYNAATARAEGVRVSRVLSAISKSSSISSIL
jgi:hypothetical protein